ncbi:MAG: hypothetical protein M3Y32_12395 [Pseudomonadota bacterium]|nr:hypothetical protein [Pseudomonadota bacterium]
MSVARWPQRAPRFFPNWAFGATLGLGVGLALVGCGSGPPQKTGTAALPPNAAASRPAAGLDDFTTRYGLAAEAAAREGRWADAVFALDVLRALRPQDTGLARLREHALRSAATAAAANLQQARAAQHRGDDEGASKYYLEVLALAPDNIEAADSLRTLERERSQRRQHNRATRSVATQRGTVDAAPGSAAATVGVGVSAAARAGNGRNEIEHANLLADQGEVDGAIAVLLPVTGGRRSDPAARALLADLYFRKAEGLQDSDPAEAIKALQRSLKIDRRQSRATQLLAALQASASRPSLK